MGKKMKAAVTKMEPRPYALRDAVALVKSAAYAKFDESVDLAIRLGVDPKRSDQMVRGTTSLPHGTGKKVRVIVFAKGRRSRRRARPEQISSAPMISWRRSRAAGWISIMRSLRRI